MPKLLWVLLPLLAVAALLAWQRLRRRVPSRLALNVAFSLLLLGYVATTAGLGIFWVAKQQLPVFDWHYLFGYATLLLLALHLVFNLPVVWRFLRRTRLRAPMAAAPTAAASPGPVSPGTGLAPPRRGFAIGVAAAALTGGVAYWLGLRQGRGDAATQAAAPARERSANAPAAGTAQAADLARLEHFHAQSSNRRAGVLLQAPGVNWGDAPPAFKLYPRRPRLALPAPGAGSTAAAAEFDLAALATVLWHTVGVTDERGAIRLRAAPSSGALFATELYVAARAVQGLAPGLWHYDALAHGLHRLDGGASGIEALGAAVGEPALHDAAAWLVATAVFRRSGHKYRDRTYRYVLADLGHALHNLHVAATARGLSCRFLPRFDEARCAAALGIDEAEEGVLALLALRPGLAAAPAAGSSAESSIAWSTGAAAGASKLGITGAMHAATSLRAPTAVTPAAATAARPGTAAVTAEPGSAAMQAEPAAQAVPAPAAHARPALAAPAIAPQAVAPHAIALPDIAPAATDPLRVIAVRRSIRRFAARPLSQETLAAVLATLDTPDALSPAVRIDVVLNALSGLAPGAWRYDAPRHALRPRRAGIDLRRAAASAALDQDAIGDAAVVFVLSLDRAALVADALGPLRGYRHALLEAGQVGERIYLAAGARGLGCCAVGAFFDDEASALVGADPAREWVVHFAALGVPG